MYCGTIITIKSHHFVYSLIAVLAATKYSCGRQVNKRQAAANAIALLSTVGNVVVLRGLKEMW